MVVVTMCIQSFVYDSLTTGSYEETFLHDFLVILQRMFQNYSKVTRTCLLGTTCIHVVCKTIQQPTIVLPVSKRLTLNILCGQTFEDVKNVARHVKHFLKVNSEAFAFESLEILRLLRYS